MTVTRRQRSAQVWRIHDLLVGALLGAAFGLALSTIVRVANGQLPLALTGAAVSVWLLRRERRHRPGIGPATIAVWVLGTLSATLIALIVYAISRFQ